MKRGDALKRGRKLGEISHPAAPSSGMLQSDCPPRWKTHRPCDRSRTFGRMHGKRTDTVPLCSRDHSCAGGGRERIDCLRLGRGTSRSRVAVPSRDPHLKRQLPHLPLSAGGWFINLRKGDRIVVLLSGPDGQQIAINRSEPLDRAKADYSAFAGKKGAPKPGVYEVESCGGARRLRVVRTERDLFDRITCCLHGRLFRHGADTAPATQGGQLSLL